MLELISKYYSLIFVWMTAIVALLSYRRGLPISYRWVLISVLIVALFDTVGTVLAARGTNTLFLYNIFFPLDILIIVFFFQWHIRIPFLRKLIRVFLLVFPLFAVFNAFFIQGFDTLNTYTLVIGGIFVMCLSIAYLWQLYASEETENIFGDPVLWFSLAWLLYFSIAVPYFGMFNYILRQFPVFTKNYFTYVFIGAIVLYNIGITIGFLCRRSSRSVTRKSYNF